MSKLAAQIARSEQLHDLLTSEQRTVVKLVGNRPRVLIAGFAGTGKTFMAVHRAITVARAKGGFARVLICCFNKNLADHIRSEMLPTGTKIDVFHFHGLADYVGDSVGLSPARRHDEEYWETGCVDRLLEAADSGALEPYDTVIVDEGQDFRKDWIEALESTLLASDGTLLVLYDPLQDIYRTGTELARRYGTPYYITTNCRNTRRICAFLKNTQPDALAQCVPSDYASEGYPPEIVCYQTDDEERRQITRIVHSLVNDHELRPRQIRLLSPFRLENTALADVEMVAGYSLLPLHRQFEVQSDGVLFTETVMSFKGLEADAVIVHDIRGDWGADAVQLYVASSRARFGLYILHHKSVTIQAGASALPTR